MGRTRRPRSGRPWRSCAVSTWPRAGSCSTATRWRDGFASLREGGLNWDAFPLRLFAKGNAKFWDPLDLDFSQDVADWADLNSEQQRCPTDPECLHQARITASAGFFGSPEFNIKGGYVFRFFKAGFSRLPGYQEMTTGMVAVTGQTQPETFQKRAQFASDFVQRPEFATLNAMSPTDYVNTLMDRYSLSSVQTPNPATPDDDVNKVTLTRAQLISGLTGGTLTRAQVLRAIADSTEVTQNEFNPSFVYMQYVGYLRRAPETQGYNNWLNYLNSHPGDFREMVRGFMDSQEYRARF